MAAPHIAPCIVDLAFCGRSEDAMNSHGTRLQAQVCNFLACPSSPLAVSGCHATAQTYWHIMHIVTRSTLCYLLKIGLQIHASSDTSPVPSLVTRATDFTRIEINLRFGDKFKIRRQIILSHTVTARQFTDRLKNN